MKCLTNLTGLQCPEDGGTTVHVVAGSHKVHSTVDRAALVETALENPSLVHHVPAPAGSTLVLLESLLHSGYSHQNYSGRERVLIQVSVLPTMYQCCKYYDLYMSFAETLDEDY